MKKIIILFVTLFILTIGFVTIILIDNGNSNNNEQVNNDNKDEDKKDDKNTDNKSEVIDNDKKDDDKNKVSLEKLNNIHEKIDFFDMSKLDDYINFKEKHSDISDEMVVVYVNIGLNKSFYTEINPSKNPTSLLVLANKYNSLSSSYVPSDLEVINSKYAGGTQTLRHDAKIAFEKLASDARNAGYNIYAMSTYRSYDYQRTLYNNYSARDGVANADRYSARPGHSEHQTGLAVDVADSSLEYFNFGFKKEFDWMKENAYRYGFILRYTQATEWITGYLNEPWHYRYVGVETATYIQNNPMTYEEYYIRFLNK